MQSLVCSQSVTLHAANRFGSASLVTLSYINCLEPECDWAASINEKRYGNDKHNFAFLYKM